MGHRVCKLLVPVSSVGDPGKSPYPAVGKNCQGSAGTASVASSWFEATDAVTLGNHSNMILRIIQLYSW